MIFTQKALHQAELIRSNITDHKISRKEVITLIGKKLHPDLGYTDTKKKKKWYS